ncbi:MAG: hypothetical protein ACPLXR_10210 [Halothiobacillaceae bacterium]
MLIIHRRRLTAAVLLLMALLYVLTSFFALGSAFYLGADQAGWFPYGFWLRAIVSSVLAAGCVVSAITVLKKGRHGLVMVRAVCVAALAVAVADLLYAIRIGAQLGDYLDFLVFAGLLGFLCVVSGRSLSAPSEAVGAGAQKGT